MWQRPTIKSDGTKYYEYILVYMDDLLILSEHPNIILQWLADEQYYRLKEVGSSTHYLGASIGKKQFVDADLWFISAEAYFSKALDTSEERFGKLDTIFKCKLNTPAPTNFYPEIDDSNFLDDNGTTLYQSYISILCWAIELGRIDLAHFGSTMAKFSIAPREGHLTAVIRCFAWQNLAQNHTQTARKNKQVCTRFSSAPVLKKYTGYWVQSVSTEGEQVL
jgi:hypothetical protein